VKNITILHEDDFSIIVNKPAGLAVQGGKGIKSSLDKILAEIRIPAPLLVHRLDRDTSGVLLAAKTKEAAAHFSSIWRKHTTKQYTAVCAGCPAQTEGSITLDLIVENAMKKSETKYKVIKTGKLSAGDALLEFSVLELELATGRMHQIRRHLAMNGTPILGDDKYGNFALNKSLRRTIGLKHLLLHASRLVIKSGNVLEICAPAPEYFREFLF
jgi:23S rRNA pseudouridine955/2504/2580 synthase